MRRMFLSFFYRDVCTRNRVYKIMYDDDDDDDDDEDFA